MLAIFNLNSFSHSKKSFCDRVYPIYHDLIDLKLMVTVSFYMFDLFTLSFLFEDSYSIVLKKISTLPI